MLMTSPQQLALLERILWPLSLEVLQQEQTKQDSKLSLDPEYEILEPK